MHNSYLAFFNLLKVADKGQPSALQGLLHSNCDIQWNKSVIRHLVLNFAPKFKYNLFLFSPKISYFSTVVNFVSPANLSSSAIWYEVIITCCYKTKHYSKKSVEMIANCFLSLWIQNIKNRALQVKELNKKRQKKLTTPALSHWLDTFNFLLKSCSGSVLTQENVLLTDRLSDG